MCFPSWRQNEIDYPIERRIFRKENPSSLQVGTSDYPRVREDEMTEESEAVSRKAPLRRRKSRGEEVEEKGFDRETPSIDL